ncbi:hypothetical protein AVEN_56422-1 [Araneus ventricosus]|uniref:Uncharacterized protein n=1 Tax=Araneus ventricosus TaxID=182803 RepID=A0A4Y2JRV2_ARAVE|nr:hypothetical protein AVEN_56422-1 [Araneus ventricosus]
MSGFFPTHSSRKITHVIYGGSKVRYRRSSIPPHFSSPISDFLASLRGPNLGRTIVFQLASQRKPQKAIMPFQSDFKLFGIPILPFLFGTFHWFVTLTVGFSFPSSENSRLEQR